MIKKLISALLPEKSDATHEDKDKIKNMPVSLAQFYGDHVPWELPIQYCAADCIKPGDTVLDIGGHIGGLAIAFGRMVGEQGRVYTFEPNREIWPHLLENLAINSTNNVTHIPLACFSKTGQLMKFFSEPSFYKAASGLMREIDGAKSFDVVTISVDDFCRANALRPSFMKIDVEGAEIHVLRSATNLLDTERMPIVLEYQSTLHPDHNDPLVYLEEKGYLFFDVNTYRKVDAKSYAAMADLPLVNVLCIHRDSKLADRYSRLTKSEVFVKQIPEKDIVIIDGISLSCGRYIVEVSFDCPDNVTGGLAVKCRRGFLAYYQADAKHLKQHSCSSMVINIKQPETVCVEFVKKGEYFGGLRKVAIAKIEIG